MPPVLHTLDLATPPLATVSRWLLDHRPGPAPEDLTDVLVLLPSQRACTTLQQALLEAADGPSLLLPRLTTPARLRADLAERFDLADPDLPDDSLRSLLLAPRLAALPWLQERPEAAVGLARELIALFDDLRLAADELVLSAAHDAELASLVQPGAETVLATDLARVREAWRLYRDLLPCDRIDGEVAALGRAAEAWPGPWPRQVVAAHLGRLDRRTAGLLEALAESGVPVHWLTPAVTTARGLALLATYRDPESDTYPLGAAAALGGRICGRRPPVPAFTAADLPGRLAERPALGDALAPAGPVRLLACHDPEHESRVVTAAVCEALRADPEPPDVIVATPDRDLAARITARLRDAGVAVDETGGRPLLTLPAGRLLRDLLRLVVAGWPFGNVFEVLTHPYVRLVVPSARYDHAVCTQLLEAAVRRLKLARGGREALTAAARLDDQQKERARPLLTEFVATLDGALAPLADLDREHVTWPDVLVALRAVWAVLAPDRQLDDVTAVRGDRDDLGAVAGLLDRLEHAAHRLPAAPLADVVASVLELARLEEVRPLRQRFLPVRVMGLVEARLESADLLVLAGLGQDRFPGRLERPLFLPDPVRRALDLPHWRARAGRDAELFLRLLHAAPRLLVTWSRQIDGREALPSPLVQRLVMVRGGEPPLAGEPEVFRREVPVIADMVAAERAHRAEPEPVPAPGVAVPGRFSHSALQAHRDCPYRFLMGNALGLRRPEPVEAEFTPADRGNLAHAVLERWLRPDGAGAAAVTSGDADRARATFLTAAEAVRDEREQDLPGSGVSWRALVELAPALVEQELTRHATWRPLALEARFELTLGQAVAWLAAREDPAPTLSPGQDAVILSGVIDRVDVARDGSPRAVVIDYKTGGVPSRRQVSDGRVLQLALYGLAVEAGGLRTHLDPDRAWTTAEAGFYLLRAVKTGYQAYIDEPDALLAGVRAIVDQLLTILDPDRPYALVPDWREAEAAGRLPCHTCEFRGICRLEERDTSDALAARVASLLATTPRRQP